MMLEENRRKRVVTLSAIGALVIVISIVIGAILNALNLKKNNKEENPPTCI